LVTQNDIARMAGVNKSTVSKALRGSSDINPETGERIREVARQMGYVHKSTHKAAPNQMIGIICPEVISGYYARIITTLTNHLLKHEYLALTALSDFSQHREEQILTQFAHMQVSGIMYITEQSNAGDILAKTFAGHSAIPLVIIGLNYEDQKHDVISVDERLGIRRIVEHLIDLGHTRIAFIGDILVQQRLRYFQDCLKHHDIVPDSRYIAIGAERHEQGGYLRMQHLLALPEPPTAVVAGYDAMALGAMRALKEAGKRVPEDISLTGFDDSSLCKYLPTALTTVNCNIEEMSRIAAAILLKNIRDPSYHVVQTVAIQPDFMVRESTRVSKQ
jgi:DNA-binding LacI/PurR family transcriptional regulator